MLNSKLIFGWHFNYVNLGYAIDQKNLEKYWQFNQ